jgi:hypothetical protein
VGPYQLGERIGAGAMGEVYRARHVALGRVCALKVLPAGADARSRQRFEREARLSARLAHPNIVALYDFGCTEEGTLYYAMELLRGETLQELIEREGPLPVERVTAILVDLCGALEAAHSAGLTHRDVKPDNIMLCRGPDAEEQTKLLDFGLVRDSALPTSRSIDKLVGTPLYLSPEAIAAPQDVGPHSDLYALGAVAFFLLTGKPVFEAESLVEVCSRHLYATPAFTGAAAVPEALQRLVLQCLEKNPAQRPTSAAVLGRRLRSLLECGAASRPRVTTHAGEPSRTGDITGESLGVLAGIRLAHQPGMKQLRYLVFTGALLSVSTGAHDAAAGPAIHSACSGRGVASSLADAQRYASAAAARFNYMAKMSKSQRISVWNGGAERTWFGAYSDTRFNNVKRRMNGISKVLHDWKLDIRCNWSKSIYGHASPGILRITLGSDWRDASTRVSDKTQTFVHEAAHIRGAVLGGEARKKYGVNHALDRADKYPGVAGNTAENIGYYAVCRQRAWATKASCNRR